MQPGIELHIEELILREFPASDRVRIGAAVERELVRLYTEQGVPPKLLRGGDLVDIATGAFHMNQGARPEAIGTQIAHAVYRGLSLGAQTVSERPAAPNAGIGGAVQNEKGLGNGTGEQAR
ncbi:hypothetical protein [Paenibacillus montanisoli]|uniref:Uncharacterized protein n=1 Tax=Paenibacillus montanisoli TaxID=2081970 RepID=A0A328UAG8_9BACL|nr:hypothetical protein [Paenibacillus montanisoli]RAP78301.1 hypothetical protein DL346_07695 [Paenibacillus montanisoli]